MLPEHQIADRSSHDIGGVTGGPKSPCDLDRLRIDILRLDLVFFRGVDESLLDCLAGFISSIANKQM